jgi:TolB-like protein/Flp pilus assembly protein TadD/DNA-binding winged helix-turn-helix (wHTH) protein
MHADLLQGFYLGDLLIEPTRGRVTGPQGSEHLPPKAIEVLICLAVKSGELVTRDELLAEVWGDTQGSQEALSHAVSEVRHALKDDKNNPRFIQTLPKRGYRLLVTPTAAHGETSTIVIGAGNSVSADQLGLFENLKRRGVLETGLAYLVLGWLLIQIADIVFGQLLLPQWAGTFVTVLVISGFPIALILSWFLEIRDGKAVLDELSPRDARRRRFSRTYLSVVSALAIAGVAVFIYDQSIGLPKAEDAGTPAVTLERVLPPVLDNSIAVLPFVNLDGSEETQIFANGLVDDVITRLSRVPGLLVSSRGDSFTLAPNSASGDVRARLRVANYLEGSVQRSGETFRIIVQMIDSETGFHVMSRSFDRPRQNLLDIRDEITNLTVGNVRVALPESGDTSSVLTAQDPDLDVYLLYRRGIEASRKPPSLEVVAEALGWFDAALEVDTDYAAAHAGKCVVYVNAYPLSDDPETIARAENSCSRALELNPNLDIVHSALGDLYRSTGKYLAAESAYLQALEINPTGAEAMTGLGITYMRQGKPGPAEEIFVRAVGLHPGNWSAYNTLGSFFYRGGRYLEAAKQYEIVVALDRSNAVGFANLGTARMLAGEFAAAADAFAASLKISQRANTHSNLGLMYYYLGRFEEAIEQHRQAVRLEPNDHLKLSNLGDALWAAGRPDDARAAFRKADSLARAALEVNPGDANVHMDLAWILAMLDDTRGAQESISAAKLGSPDDPYVDFIQALIWLRSNDIDAALSSLEDAVVKGYTREMIAAEPHLASLRQHPKFNRLLAQSETPGND